MSVSAPYFGTSGLHAFLIAFLIAFLLLTGLQVLVLVAARRLPVLIHHPGTQVA